MFSFSALSPLDKRISSWTNSRESKLGLPSPVPLEQHCRHFRTAVRINKECVVTSQRQMWCSQAGSGT